MLESKNQQANVIESKEGKFMKKTFRLTGGRYIYRITLEDDTSRDSAKMEFEFRQSQTQISFNGLRVWDKEHPPTEYEAEDVREEPSSRDEFNKLFKMVSFRAEPHVDYTFLSGAAEN